MKKLTIFAAVAFGAMSASSHATSVGFSATPADRTLLTATSTNVPAGDLVLEGVFTNPNSFTYNPAISIAANVANMSSFGWQQFGLNPSNQSSEGSGSLQADTVFSGTVVGGSVTDVSGTPGSGQNASYFDNKQVYLVVFNGTTIAGSTQMGVFTSTSWTFPTNAGGLGDSITYDTSTTYNVTDVGNAGSVSNTGGPNSSGTLQLAAGVPEPSTLATLFGATGFLALLRRRRTE